MQIRINLYLTFKERAPGGENSFSMEMPDGSTLDEALESLGISSREPKVALINGRSAASGAELKDGDQLTVFPPMEGG
jgi:sulfur carrier protein ThiS